MGGRVRVGLVVDGVMEVDVIEGDQPKTRPARHGHRSLLGDLNRVSGRRDPVEFAGFWLDANERISDEEEFRIEEGKEGDARLEE